MDKAFKTANNITVILVLFLTQKVLAGGRMAAVGSML